MRKDGAHLTKPAEPHVTVFGETRRATRQAMVEQIIDIFSDAGYTYEEAYETLENVNQTLIYRSQYVPVSYHRSE